MDSLPADHQGSPRILEWAANPSPADLPDPGIKPWSPALQVDSLPAELSGIIYSHFPLEFTPVSGLSYDFMESTPKMMTRVLLYTLAN